VFDTIFVLPPHPLIDHATVVIVPSAALAVALAAGWPRFRRWAGFLPLLLSAAAVVLIPLSTASGEARADLLPPVLVLAVAAAALYWIQLTEQARRPGRPGVAIMAAVLLIASIGSAGTLVQVSRATLPPIRSGRSAPT
jgi:hypothetical protein